MFSWLTAAFQSLAALLGIAKNVSDAKNSPDAKAAAKAQQEVTEEGREAAEVSRVTQAKTPTEKQRALVDISADAAE